MKHNPEEDGITHINIYSKAKTTFGRTLSNFALTPFTHPDDGKFSSVEGYWYWLLVTSLNKSLYFLQIERAEELRSSFGFAAKKLGRDLLPKGYLYAKENSEEFENKIKKAFMAKVSSHTALQEWMVMKEFDLPFAHYLVFGNTIKELPQHDWQVELWEQIRKQLKIERAMDFFLH